MIPLQYLMNSPVFTLSHPTFHPFIHPSFGPLKHIKMNQKVKTPSFYQISQNRVMISTSPGVTLHIHSFIHFSIQDFIHKSLLK
jgi:hypothetical protein